MNIRDLRYFLAVNQYKHFRKAAEACCVSQPALSMQLKKLEDELGVPLFERGNKTPLVTDVGQTILPLAQQVIRQVDAIKEIAATAHDPFAGQLKLGAFPTLAPYLFPKVIKKINKKLPKLTLLLVEEKTEVLLQQLLSGELDAALLALPIHEPHLQYQLLFEDPFYLAVAKTHALADLKKISQAKLHEQTLLLLSQGHCLRDQALDVCHSSAAVEDASFRATSLETLRQMVAIDSGITLMPQIARSKSDGLQYIPFTKPVPSRKIAMVWRKQCHKQPCIEVINEVISTSMI